MKTISLQPIISEKSMNMASTGVYMFEANKAANKLEIAAEVHQLFKVDVVTVRTSVLKGKTKRFKGTIGRRSDTKRAFVTLKDGQKIAIFDAEEKKEKDKK
jgi:large subunit ribosomal protein L23